MDTASATVARIARECRARLLAIVAARTRDLAGAEDALADAFHEALRRWPGEGVPGNPEGWLLTVARRRLIDSARRRNTAETHAESVRAHTHDAMLGLCEEFGAANAFPDERLKLLFVCAHPAIEAKMRTPLMLQTVLGLDAVRIGALFLVSPVAMGKRLVRVKDKIRAAGIPFTVPSGPELPPRLAAVLDAVYAAFTAAWYDAPAPDDAGPSLAEQAIDLARTLDHLLPEQPETLSLLALMLHSAARAPAATDAEGRFVPLHAQDCTRWDLRRVREADLLIARASTLPGGARYQIEATLQSCHSARAHIGATPWTVVLSLYRRLLAEYPSIGASVAYAAALLNSGNAHVALQQLDTLDPEAVSTYQPWWATRAETLAALDRPAEAAAAFDRALALTSQPMLRHFLENRKLETGNRR